jgi:hypothetical protein
LVLFFAPWRPIGLAIEMIPPSPAVPFANSAEEEHCKFGAVLFNESNDHISSFASPGPFDQAQIEHFVPSLPNLLRGLAGEEGCDFIPIRIGRITHQARKGFFFFPSPSAAA